MNILQYLIPKKEVAYVLDSFSVRQTLEKMEFHHYSNIPILNVDGKYIGAISEGDILWFWKNNNLSFNKLNGKNIMEINHNRIIHSIKIDATLNELTKLIINQNFVPVVDDRNIFIGIITRKAVMKELTKNIMKKELEIVVATNNMHKIKEYEEMFKPYNIKITYPKALGINIDPVEDGLTYEDNSLIKAKAIQKYTSLPIIADDSGLNIEALNNFPGIYSSRFADSKGGNKTANKEIIKMLTPYKNKNAFFTCVITLLNLEKEPLQFKGICPGYILDKPEGENGFGYDPIFFSKEANGCFGTLDEQIKNKYSHRSKAFTQLIDYLKDNKFID